MSRKHLLRCFVCCSKFFFDWKVRCNGVSFNLPAQLWAGKTNQQCCSLSERKISLPWWVPIFSVYPGSSTIEHGGTITAYQLFDWCTTAGTHLFTMQDVQTSCRIWTRTFHVWLPSYLRTSFASYHLKVGIPWDTSISGQNQVEIRCRWHPDYLDPYLSSQVKIIGTWKAHKKKACKNGYGFWMFLVSSSWYPLVSFFFLAIGYASLKLPWYSNRSPCVFVSVFLKNHDQTSTTEQCDLNQYVALFLYSGWSADFQEWIVISNILDSVTPI